MLTSRRFIRVCLFSSLAVLPTPYVFAGFVQLPQQNTSICLDYRTKCGLLYGCDPWAQIFGSSSSNSSVSDFFSYSLGGALMAFPPAGTYDLAYNVGSVEHHGGTANEGDCTSGCSTPTINFKLNGVTSPSAGAEASSGVLSYEAQLADSFGCSVPMTSSVTHSTIDGKSGWSGYGEWKYTGISSSTLMTTVDQTGRFWTAASSPVARASDTVSIPLLAVEGVYPEVTFSPYSSIEGHSFFDIWHYMPLYCNGNMCDDFPAGSVTGEAPPEAIYYWVRYTVSASGPGSSPVSASWTMVLQAAKGKVSYGGNLPQLISGSNIYHIDYCYSGQQDCDNSGVPARESYDTDIRFEGYLPTISLGRPDHITVTRNAFVSAGPQSGTASGIGDYNNDSACNFWDRSQVAQLVATGGANFDSLDYHPSIDIDQDGDIDGNDLDGLYSASNCCIADVNGDGVTDSADQSAFYALYQSQAGTCTGRCSADFNANGSVTIQDYFLYLQVYNTQVGWICN